MCACEYVCVCACVYVCVCMCVCVCVCDVCIRTGYNVLCTSRPVGIHVHVVNPNTVNHTYGWITSRPFLQGDVHGSIAGNFWKRTQTHDTILECVYKCT